MGVVEIEGDGYRLLKITGFLDGHTPESRELEETLADASEGVDTHLVLDLSAVEYVNSSILGKFVKLLAAAQAAERQVLILNPPPSVRNVLELTGLSHVLPVVRHKQEIAGRLGLSPEERVAEADVDYDALSSEIESIIVRGSAPEEDDDSQIDRLLGR